MDFTVSKKAQFKSRPFHHNSVFLVHVEIIVRGLYCLKIVISKNRLAAGIINRSLLDLKKQIGALKHPNEKILKEKIILKKCRREFPVGIYLLKVNNKNTRTRCEICSK